MSTRMHDDELDIDDALVRALLREQMPQWADLSIERVVSSGTDNAMFRLGEELVVRLPRIEWAVAAVDKEHRWLPFLAPHLPVASPVPVAKGEPGEGYPWPWSVYSWIDGSNAFDAPLDVVAAAYDIASIIHALQRIDTAGGPTPQPGRRGTSLTTTERQTRAAIAAARDLVDTDAVTVAWEAALRAPEFHAEPVWFHADIARGNLLVRDRRIVALIDFSGVGVGDPACDLVVAWDLFDADGRDRFRRALDVDDPTWDRGRGWALCTALWALPYYLHTNPPMVWQARRKITEVLTDTA